MHDNPIGFATPDAEDAAIELAVLAELLTLGHPLTLDELVRHMAAFHSEPRLRRASRTGTRRRGFA